MRAAYYLGLPAYGPVPLPRIVERWTVPKGHFIHKKSQENFERKTHRRMIQIKDGHPETVEIWLAFLQKHSYYGIGMKANVWNYEKLGMFALYSWEYVIDLGYVTLIFNRAGRDDGQESERDEGRIRSEMGTVRLREGIDDG